jgi:hypothetical protein
MCETLKDICADYQELYPDRPLAAEYKRVTRRCLVVFTQPGTCYGVVRAALNYVHRSLTGLEHSLSCNANFNGKSVPVPPEWINEVIWL